MILHDPRDVAKQLRTILENPGISTGFFLGAGCPFSIKLDKGRDSARPLIGDIRRLTKGVSRLISSDSDEDIVAAYWQLVRTLRDDGCRRPNVENILTRIRQSREIVGVEEIRGLSSDALAKLERRICRAVVKFVNVILPPGSPYHAVANLLSRKKTSHTALFTTNYDLLAEQAFDSVRIPYFDGFIGSHRPFFARDVLEDDKLLTHWILLSKLHGSINWRMHDGHVCRSTPELCDDIESPTVDTVLIHPSHDKYAESRRMPFAAMFSRLKAFIHNDARPVVLFVSGYSFSDEHVNDALIGSLQRNVRASCYALQFDDLDKCETAVRCVKETDNLNVLARDGAVLGRRRGLWKPRRDDPLLKLVFKQSSPENGDAAPIPNDSSDVSDQKWRFELGDFVKFGKYLNDLSVQHQNVGDATLEGGTGT